MANFESGVSGFIHTKAVVNVCFPIDNKGVSAVSCNYCKYYSRYNRQCKLTDEVVPYPERYVGNDCPLELEPVEEV